MAKLTYNPSVFEARDLEAARRIILTTERDQTTDLRWERETPYLADLLGKALNLKLGQTVIDYGCGVGRLSKALMEQFNCRVVGVDISEQMRSLAPGYVGWPAFSAVSPQTLDQMIADGFQGDAAISVWVLQHCVTPQDDIARLRRALPDGAPLGLVNMRGRAVPTQERGWASDGLDVDTLVRAQFPDGRTEGLDPGVVGDHIASFSYWGVYR
ncbi:methyltransferase domain-containing protein [Phenylobacterium sp.]|uniref:class I SAM-dependent methyltransferase n=1 Tax=Phenylobacterium sp. TaxID=1871053 RepID=UPI0025E79558|nr:methyltransferase domain-containing protein [Phenylobacterium sp.]